ncbi:MAG: hypothetical protein A4S09_15660 [Proteobacteria bacterium SG_bin7]|nr:MAG: hypothetical protein A4S09_15660 [Proteobacteria bacterium SG_bin7]
MGETVRTFPTTSKEDVEALLRASTKDLKPGENVTIFINNHGGSPNSLKDPKSAAVLLYKDPLNILTRTPKITHTELEGLIQKYVPKSTKVNLVGIHCFSGALHHISFSGPNICSSSSTDFKSRTNTPEETNAYGRGFWNELENKNFDLNKDGKTSLYEAHLSALSHDPYNNGKGELSSITFVSSVLGEGEYIPQGFLNLLSNMNSEPVSINKFIKLCDLRPSGIDIKRIQLLAKQLNDLMSVESNFSVNRDKLPEPTKTVFDFAVNDWEKNQKRV